ncbi:MAG: sialidase family protein, partial [Bacteroidota bacterium]
HRGTIYINWADQRNGVDNTDIWVTRSTDGGDTWSEPTRVNDDAGKAHQFFSWMAVDQTTGYLYVVFYDRRNHAEHETDVYLAYSTDGGASFTNVKISESPFVPDKSVFFGDYNNISVHGGVIRPIWTRYAGRKLSIWTALINEKTLLEQRKTD